MAPRTYIGEGPEDHPETPKATGPREAELAAHEAWTSMQAAWYHLRMRAAQGDAWAIDRLAELAADLADLFTPRHPEDLTDACRLALDAKAAQETEWPAMIPADARDRQKVLEQIDSLGLGSSALFRVYRGGRGHPPDSHIEGSPSHVAKLLVIRLNSLRRIMSDRTLLQVTDLVNRYDVQFLEAVFGLPRFSRESLDQWTEQAVRLALDARYRAEFIPQKWDVTASERTEKKTIIEKGKLIKKESPRAQGKDGFASYLIKRGMKTIAPDGSVT